MEADGRSRQAQGEQPGEVMDIVERAIPVVQALLALVPEARVISNDYGHRVVMTVPGFTPVLWVNSDGTDEAPEDYLLPVSCIPQAVAEWRKEMTEDIGGRRWMMRFDPTGMRQPGSHHA